MPKKRSIKGNESSFKKEHDWNIKPKNIAKRKNIDTNKKT